IETLYNEVLHLGYTAARMITILIAGYSPDNTGCRGCRLLHLSIRCWDIPSTGCISPCQADYWLEAMVISGLKGVTYLSFIVLPGGTFIYGVKESNGVTTQ